MSEVRLHGVLCPSCGARTHTMCLEAGPQLVHHRVRGVKDGVRTRCEGQWVAVPENGQVRLIPVAGRQQADAVLRSEATRWYESLVAAFGMNVRTA